MNTLAPEPWKARHPALDAVQRRETGVQEAYLKAINAEVERMMACWPAGAGEPCAVYDQQGHLQGLASSATPLGTVPVLLVEARRIRWGQFE